MSKGWPALLVRRLIPRRARNPTSLLRDRRYTFDLVIVCKRQLRPGDVDTIGLWLCARGSTTGEISAHVAEIYGASLSKDRITAITDKVVDTMTDQRNRSLQPRLHGRALLQ